MVPLSALCVSSMLSRGTSPAQSPTISLHKLTQTSQVQMTKLAMLTSVIRLTSVTPLSWALIHARTLHQDTRCQSPPKRCTNAGRRHSVKQSQQSTCSMPHQLEQVTTTTSSASSPQNSHRPLTRQCSTRNMLSEHISPLTVKLFQSLLPRESAWWFWLKTCTGIKATRSTRSSSLSASQTDTWWTWLSKDRKHPA